MSIINFTEKGSFNNIERYLRRLSTLDLSSVLNHYGALGVDALSNATPVDTGLTASSWYYEIVQRPGYYSIRWYNSHVVEGRPIAILLQYGHGTGTGGYVEGRDYINPAIQPIFDQIASDIEKEVSRV
jgi:hypothetical protein